MTTPQYDQNIPSPNDLLSTSQEQFLTNFQQLYDAFAKNHVALDGGTTAGNHTVAELLQQAKGFETNFGELSVYSKDVEGQTDQLFLRYQGNSAEVQLTNYQLYSLPNTSSHVQYFTFLPGKVLVYFGIFNATFGGVAVEMNLSPPIAKNIITMNFTTAVSPLSPLPLQPPRVDPAAANNGFITKILLVNPSFIPFNQTLYYIILANI